MRFLFIRILFTFLGLCALLTAVQFGYLFVQIVLTAQISLLLFMSLLFFITSLGASCVALYVVRYANILKSRKRLTYAVLYVLMLLPSIMTSIALKKDPAPQTTLLEQNKKR